MTYARSSGLARWAGLGGAWASEPSRSSTETTRAPRAVASIVARSLSCVITTGAPASAIMKAMRSAGYDGSTGT